MSKNDTIILKQIKQSGKALTAYEILDQTRSFGIKSPPQVYRSLTNLIGKGHVHKVESLNVFIACTHHHTNQNTVFLVCDVCKHVTELDADVIENCSSALVKEHEFIPAQMTLEIKGLCKQCQVA